MAKMGGYQVITYRFRLACSHKEWLYETKKQYNLVLNFYYEILLKWPEMLNESNQKLLRNLELLTIGAKGQEKSEVEALLPYKKIPLYFRRAAINDAIRLSRSYQSGKEQGANPAKGFHASPIFYKGMYKEITESSVCLKLWNGEKWVWELCKMDTCKRKMPKEEQMLSPVLKLEGKTAMLHIPIVKTVEDIRSVNERMKIEEKFCAAYFPCNDCLAVLAILNREGICTDQHFIRGGKEFAHRKKLLLNRIRKNQAVMGSLKLTSCCQSNEIQLEELKKKEIDTPSFLTEKDSVFDVQNKHLKQKIKNLSENKAHQISRQIVNYCIKQQVKLIVVPHYKQEINLNAIGYTSVSSYDWIGRRVIKYLRYKAFGSGIVVTSVSPNGIASHCHICGKEIKRSNKNKTPSKNYYGGKNFICPNGHQGNAALNSAIYVGKKFLKSYGETHR